MNLADIYRRRYGLDGSPLTNDELLFLFSNAQMVEESLSARGAFWRLAISAIRAERESLQQIVQARGLTKPEWKW